MPFLIFFGVNSNELSTISDELATANVKEFETMFRECTSAAYSFLGVNMKKAVSSRYSCSFVDLK